MRVDTTAIPDVLIITPTRHGDLRGFFMEVFRQDVFDAAVPGLRFVQDNHSRSAQRGTVRGLHFQRAPRAQGKLVRVAHGAVLDVAVDVRQGSASFGRHVAVELSADNARQLWVPPGFLHGFCTLTDDAEVLYKVTDFYSPSHDGAVRWNDPALAIDWPVKAGEAVLSPKDAAAPLLAEAGLHFREAPA
jgi:dTDP-4-dehydrorhamnose 3,5-epimerase